MSKYKMNNLNYICVTYVEKHGAFLKIWGQLEKTYILAIETSLKDLLPQLEQKSYVPSIENIQPGLFCFAKYNGKYYRARIINISMLQQSYVEVHFLDYGNREVLSLGNLRISNFGPAILSIPPQAHDYILASVTHLDRSWDINTVALISSELCYSELQFLQMQQVNSHALIRVFKNGEDYALSLFNRGLVLSMAAVSQNMILQNCNLPSTHMPFTPPLAPTSLTPTPLASSHITPIPLIPPPLAPTSITTTSLTPTIAPTPTLLSYKVLTLTPGCEEYIYVSYVSDGPCQFSIQLQRLEESLANLMKELNRMQLHALDVDDPIPGTVCVAKCVEDEHICRAVVTNLIDGQYKVYYVDFGNSEIVPITNLYKLPFKYVVFKVMAMRYALAGLERSSVTLEMKCAFKNFVSDKLLRMRALPAPNRSSLPLCTLWDQNDVNVLDVLQKAAMLAYPDVLQLTRGFNQEVIVSYVYSCSHFYVQLKSKQDDLCTLMTELQVHCPQAEEIQISQIKEGLPCCALFDADEQWYRAQVLAAEDNIVKVRYVDYGNEELVTIGNLRMPVGNLLQALRPQAIECCLNGYQKMTDDQERDNILEELILEKEFNMRVIEIQNSKALVDLVDDARYNVGSLLLEKLASARSQVSPLLIQDNYHIELRRKTSKESPPHNDGIVKADRQSSWENDKSRDSNKAFNRTDSIDRYRSESPKEKRLSRESSSSQFGRDEWTNSVSNELSPNNNNNKQRQDSWRKEKFSRSGFSNDDGEETYKGRRDNFRNSTNAANNTHRFDRDGSGDWQNHKKDYKRDNWRSNDTFSSTREFNGDSENDWRKNKKESKPFRQGNNFKSRNEWNATTKSVEDPASDTDVFTYLDLKGKSEEICISWFHNPSTFYCQIKSYETEFRILMDDIQNSYCNINSENVPVDAPVIALFPEDKVLYRARIVELKGNQYYVQYVDFGNFATTNKVWRIEKKFMSLPAQAMCCALSNIGPSSENWPEGDSLSKYFDKEVFTCAFIEEGDNGYLVDLFYNDKNIGEVLVTEGLATFQSCDYNFDPAILVGQNLQVVLGEIQSLDNFYVTLPNNMNLLCSLHNIELATEMDESGLKRHTGSTVIMCVKSVSNEKLHITLYDKSGFKIKIIEPDQGVLNAVEPLCPLPVLSTVLNGWISYLTKIDDHKIKAYIQPTEYALTITELLDNLYNYYDLVPFDESLEIKDGSFYAIHSSDTNWYRGLVYELNDENVTVLYVDYGNSETVARTEIRELALEFIELHILALEVAVLNCDESYLEQDVVVTLCHTVNGWEGKIGESPGDMNNTTTANVNAELMNNTTTANVNAEVKESSEVFEEVIEHEQKPAENQHNQIGILVSHVDSPSEFYIQLLEALDSIDYLQAILQEEINNYPDLENPAAGVLCAAPYSVDLLWYRAQVLDGDSDITTVRFVDFGNTDVITNATTQIKTLSPEMLALEQHARKCSLLIKPKDDIEWSSAACERFEALINDSTLSVEIIHQDEKQTYIDLYANGENVADVLLNENLAARLELEMKRSGYVSNFNSPSEFWIQLENSVPELELVDEHLYSAQDFPELEDLTPGSLCAGLYPDDEKYYRARILSNTVAGIEVIFIDYGNSCTCTGVRQLPEHLIMLPPLAQKCSLQKPRGILQWSSLASQKFRNISADGATIFNIEKLSTGETSVVKLLMDGEDISLQLLPITEKGYITHMDSIFSVWIQKCEDKTTLDEIEEKLASAFEWPKIENVDVDTIVVAMQMEDEIWYRAKVLGINEDEYEVLFIDYGNISITKEIRPYVEDNILPLANKFTVEPPPGFRWIEEDATNKLLEISNEGAEIFDVEFASEDVIRLYLNELDIRLNMDTVCISSVQSSPKKSRSSVTDSIINKNIMSDLKSSSELLQLTEECMKKEIEETLNQSSEVLEPSEEYVIERKIETTTSNIIEETFDGSPEVLKSTEECMVEENAETISTERIQEDLDQSSELLEPSEEHTKEENTTSKRIEETLDGCSEVLKSSKECMIEENAETTSTERIQEDLDQSSDLLEPTEEHTKEENTTSKRIETLDGCLEVLESSEECMIEENAEITSTERIQKALDQSSELLDPSDEYMKEDNIEITTSKKIEETLNELAEVLESSECMKVENSETASIKTIQETLESSSEYFESSEDYVKRGNVEHTSPEKSVDESPKLLQSAKESESETSTTTTAESPEKALDQSLTSKQNLENTTESVSETSTTATTESPEKALDQSLTSKQNLENTTDENIQYSSDCSSELFELSEQFVKEENATATLRETSHQSSESLESGERCLKDLETTSSENFEIGTQLIDDTEICVVKDVYKSVTNKSVDSENSSFSENSSSKDVDSSAEIEIASISNDNITTSKDAETGDDVTMTKVETAPSENLEASNNDIASNKISTMKNVEELK